MSERYHASRMAERVGIRSPARRVPDAQFQRALPRKGPGPFWLVLGTPTFRRPVLATASHGQSHSGPNKVGARSYFKTMSRSDTFSGDELPRPVGPLARHCPLANDPVAPVAPSMAERVGFEPTVQLPGQRFSRPPDSAALAPLRSWGR